jgi:hypothetical protein
MKSRIARVVIGLTIGLAVYLSVHHEVTCYNLDGKEWGGVITGKAVSVGRSSTFYFRINDPEYGVYSISVHPITYNDYDIGDAYSSRFKYVPIIGLSGAAYRPNDKYGDFSSIAVSIMKLTMVASFVLFLAFRFIKEEE